MDILPRNSILLKIESTSQLIIAQSKEAAQDMVYSDLFILNE